VDPAGEEADALVLGRKPLLEPASSVAALRATMVTLLRRLDAVGFPWRAASRGKSYS
jgi:hypothetical protein